MIPLEHEPVALQLLAEPGNVVRDEFGGMRIDLERVVLGVDAERVEADGLEDLAAA